MSLTLPREITPALGGLPRREWSFSGRGDELATIVDDLDRFPVVTIVGMPGVGKTTLAVQAAWRAWKDEGRFPGGVLIIDLQGYDDRLRLSTRRALTQLLAALAVPREHIPDDAQELTRLYRSVLAAYADQGRRLLVVVDNAAGEEQARPLLPSDGCHAAVVTSRHNLVLGEARTVLRPLDTDTAVELLRRVLGPRDERVDRDRASAERIADLCGHLPLALQIVAALLADVPAKPPAALAAELAEAHLRLDALAREERTVRAAFDLSYRRLRPEDARLFRLLALNPGPDLGTEAVIRMTDDRVGSSLESLARAHLLETPRWDRWRFHDLVRLYAEERAAADGGEELAEARHLLNTYYVDNAAAASLNLNDIVVVTDDHPLGRFSANVEAGIAWLDEEYANLLATAVRARDEADHRLSAVLPCVVGGYLRLRRVLPQWTELLETAVEAAEALGDVELTGMALDLLGLALQEEGRPEEAALAARRAARRFRRIGERFRQSAALSHLGSALAHQGRFEQAARILRLSADRLKAEGGGSMSSRTHTLKDLGEVLFRLGRFEEAAEFSAEAARCFSWPMADELSEAEAQLTQGAALLHQGDLNGSTIALQRANELFHKHGNLSGVAATLDAHAGLLRRRGEDDRAVEFLHTALDCAEEAGDDNLRADIAGNLVTAYTTLGRPGEAARLAASHGVDALPPPPAPSTVAALTTSGRRVRQRRRPGRFLG
ncbi:tetratricopeptide repeat protein [Kitasatospora purpeofusca]|uniref:tetratricopeptide repeat protein n=1 Tax=Kitasatospora purpeofusca TaxID=67352 RepID=UPI0030F3EE15